MSQLERLISFSLSLSSLFCCFCFFCFLFLHSALSVFFLFFSVSSFGFTMLVWYASAARKALAVHRQCGWQLLLDRRYLRRLGENLGRTLRRQRCQLAFVSDTMDVLAAWRYGRGSIKGAYGSPKDYHGIWYIYRSMNGYIIFMVHVDKYRYTSPMHPMTY